MTQTMDSRSAASWVREALWNPQAHMPAAGVKRVVISGGEGVWLTTSTGHRILDATATLRPANVGHGREHIHGAAYERIQTLETYHRLGRFANDRPNRKPQ